jgi:hypothetical protein
MKCEKAQELFSEHLEGKLEKPMRVAFEKHLAECSECTKAFESFQITWRMLDELPQLEPPIGFAASVMMAVQMEKEAQIKAKPWWQKVWSEAFTTRIPAKVFAAAVAVFLCVQIMLNTPLRGVFVSGPPQLGPTAPNLEAGTWSISPAEAWLKSGLTFELAGSWDTSDRSIFKLLLKPNMVTSKQVKVYLMKSGQPRFDDASIAASEVIFNGTVEENGRIIPFVLGKSSKQDVMVVLVEWEHRQRLFREAVFVPVLMAPGSKPIVADLHIKNMELYAALQQVSGTFGVVVLAQADVNQMIHDVNVENRTADDALYELTREAGLKYRPLGPQVYSVERKYE